MQSLILSFESISPIFLLMLLGYFLKSINIVDVSVWNAVNKLIFKVFLPVLMFNNLYTTGTLEVFDLKLVIFTLTSILCVFILGYFAVLIITKDNRKRGAMLQGIFRSNFVILGVPLVNYICGQESSGLTSVMVAIVVPTFNILAVVCLERFRDGHISVKKLLKGIVTNPLIIGCAAGALFLVLGIKLPSFLEKAVSDTSKIASPLAMIVLGASFTFSSVKGYLKEIIITVSSRLVLVPLITVTAAVLLGFTGEALACIMIVFGAPVAVSSFAMAQQMNSDDKLAAQLVVISSAFCLITLFLWIFVLDLLRLF